MIDCEHFFDGYKANRAYALAVATHRLQGGRALGGAVRHQRRHAAARDRATSSPRWPSTCRARISASTPTTTPRMRSPTRWPPCAPARARSRARSTGSASAAATPTSPRIIPTLLLKSEFADRFETQRDARAACASSRMPAALLDEILNRAPNRQAPYVGEAAFATKAGIHASRHPEGARDLRARARRRASATAAACWSPTRPASRTCSPSWSGSACPSDRDDPRVAQLLDEVKAREAVGYAYEGADASFELLARRLLGEVPRLLPRRQLPRRWSRSATTRSASSSPCRKPP